MKSKGLKFMAAGLAVALLATVGALSATAVRHGRWHGGDGMFGGGPGMHFMAKYLDLTDGQKDQAKQIMQKERANFKPLMEQMRENRKLERQIVQAPNFDEAQAQAFAARQAQVSTALTVQKLKVEAELYQILTQEQKDKLNQFLDQREQKFQQRLQQKQQNQQQQQPSSNQ